MRKIAVPAEDGNLCSHFGHCRQFIVFTVDNNEIVKENRLEPPEHKPGAFPRWLNSLGVEEVIAGGMGEKAKAIFKHYGTKVHTGVENKAVRTLVEDLLNGRLLTGVNDHHHHHHHHNHQDHKHSG